MEKIYIILNLFRIIPAYALVCLFDSSHTIREDLKCWTNLYKIDETDFWAFGKLVCRKKEFRNVIINRLKRKHVILGVIFKLFFKPMDTLFINTEDIGERLFIQHGFSTIIAAKKIGADCWINQQVTIGYEQDRQPVIGNHVRICAGAIIIGNVTVGDNAIIAANAVVTKDVPSNEVWGGCPAKFIKKVNKDSFSG